MSERLPRGVIVAHSDLARALVSAVERIAGIDEDVLVAVSNEGLGPNGLRERLDEVLGEDPGIVFADLREGSCGAAGRQVCLGGGPRALVTGVNLPMLLDFVMKRHLPLPELVARVADRGRGAIGTLAEGD